MTVTDFLHHWSLTENPFRGEEARSDAVFAKMGEPTGKAAADLGTFHSDFEKIMGDLRRPGSSVVFGEKGSGKTAIRLQIAKRVSEYNLANPGAKLLLVPYDDLNGVLDRLHERLGGKTPLESLQKLRLVDHIDAIIHSVVPRLTDALLDPDSIADGLDLGQGEGKPVKRLDADQRKDVLLLQAVYDRPDHAQFRTVHLRRRLRIAPPAGVLWGGIALAVMPLLLVAGLIYVNYFTLPDILPRKVADWTLAGAAILYAAFALKFAVWDRLKILRTGHRVRKQIRVIARGDVSYARALRQISPAVREAANLPLSDSDEPRYLMLERLKRVLRCFGFTGLMVIIDRVDEPTLISGDPDRMKAVIWPLLNNKFLQQEGLGVKMLLPMELRHAVFRESSAFFQEARLDKQSLIEHLAWTGAMLYDLCEARMAACAYAGASAPKLLDLFAEDVTRQDVVDALDRLHQPRDAFKLMYRCVSEHCAAVTRGQEDWRIPRHILNQVVKLETERVQGMFRGIRPG
ncbi:MAG: hypothetical protein JSR77_09320 [Planctomycetes bacterium]|nr:hypothetical protein [Planctomycetota bacterium]